MKDKKQQPELQINDNVEIVTHNGQQEEQNPINLIALAVEKGSPIETIEKLQLMYERWENRKREQAYSEDFVLMKGELPLVVKGKENKFTRSKYAPLEDVNQVVDPVLKKYGFGTSAKVVKQTETTVTVCAQIRHKLGHVEQMEIEVPIDDAGMDGKKNKTKIQGIGSSVTYAKRIAICALLNISTGDDNDGNATSPKAGNSEDQIVEEIKQLLELKWENLTGDEQVRANAIIKNKEVSSYIKLRNALKNK